MGLSRALLAVIVAVAAGLALAAFAPASVPQPFNATGQLLSATSTDNRTAGPNGFELVLATISSTGTFTGVYVGQAANIIHANGQTQLHFTYTATTATAPVTCSPTAPPSPANNNHRRPTPGKASRAW